MADIATPFPTPRLLGVRALLVIVALLELADGLPNSISMFADMSRIPGPDLGSAIIQAHIATHPVLALAALLFAAIGRVRYAIMALGAVVIMTWLNYMPSVMLWGLEFSGIGAFETPAQVMVFPLLAASAIVLAVRNQRLKLAAVLVSLPTIFNLFGLIAFAIGVAIHGF
jgi:hypothetical protein